MLPGRATARRSAQGACLDVGRGRIQQAGHYTIAIESPAVEGVNIRETHPLARRPLRATDRNGVLAILGAALVLVMLFAFRSLAPRGRSRAPRAVRLARVRIARARRRRPVLAATMTLVGGLLGLYGAAMLPRALFPMSSAYVLLGGGVLALGEVFLAWMLIDPGGVGLALKRPNSVLATAAFFVAAPFVGLGLRMFAGWALSHVESTGEAPSEAFVSWPSGLLSLQRTRSRGADRRRGVLPWLRVRDASTTASGEGRRALACVASFGLFAGAHWEQVQGNWGGLLSVTMAGVVFTLLRAFSGSTLVPAIAHLTYNALLSASVLTAGAILILPRVKPGITAGSYSHSAGAVDHEDDAYDQGQECDRCSRAVRASRPSCGVEHSVHRHDGEHHHADDPRRECADVAGPREDKAEEAM